MVLLTNALPGLYVVALAALVYVALAAWFERIPGRVVLVHAGLIALILGPHLFLGRSLLPVSNLRGCSVFGAVSGASAGENPLHHDLLVQALPTMSALREALARGELPLRDDSMGGGVPLWGDQQAQVLQPLMLASLAFPPERAMVVLAALRLLLALSFSFLFFRAQCGSPGGALAGSIAFGLGGFLQLWLGWPLASSAAWLPVLLYAIRRVIDFGTRRDAVLLAAATFGLLTAGHPETLIYALAFSASFAAMEIFRASAPRRRRIGFMLAAAIGIGGSLTAPLNLPSMRAIAMSERSLVLAYASALREQSREAPREKLERFASILAPDAWGNDRFGKYWGPENTNEDGSGYAGSAALLLCLLAIAGRPRDRNVLFLLAWLIGCVLIISAAGVFGWAAWNAPVLRTSASGGHRLLLLVNWIVAWLAVIAVARAEQRAHSRAVIAVAAALLAASIIAIYVGSAPADLSGVHASRREAMLATQIVAVALTAIASMLTSRRIAGGLLIATIAAELAIAHVPANPPGRATMPAAPPLLAALRERAGDWRVQATPSAIRPNLGSLYGIRQIEVYNPIQPSSWFSVVVGIEGAPTEAARRDAEAWLDALGVRFLLRSRAEMDASRPNILADASSVVIERPTAQPLFRFATDAAAAPDDSLVAHLYLPQPRRVEVIARRAAGLRNDVVPWLLASPPRGGQVYVANAQFWSDAWRPVEEDSLELTEKTPGRLTFDVRTRGPRLLVTTESDDGGWEALADGRRIAVERINGSFAGVRVPAGTSRVVLRYVPPGLAGGVALALFAIILGVTLLVICFRDRR